MYTPLHRMTIVTALACALLAATTTGPAGARPPDPRTEAQTSSHAGTTARQDRRSPDALDAKRRNEIALALKRYYSTYGEPKPLPVAEAPAPVDEDTPWLPNVIAIAATLAIVAASATHLLRLRVRRRRTAGGVS